MTPARPATRSACSVASCCRPRPARATCCRTSGHSRRPSRTASHSCARPGAPAPNPPEAVAALVAGRRPQGGLGLVEGGGLARVVADPETLATACEGLEPVLTDVASAGFDAVAHDALEG